MCGIAGYFCTRQYDPRLAVATPLLGLHMRERGKHSWGITDGHSMKKYVGDIMDSYEGQYLESMQLLLHTRHATVGAQTAENSHPFLIDGLLGVHNGQVYNHKEVADRHNIQYQVDSEVLLSRLANYGNINEIEAYGAVVFFQDDILHIGKFNGGQMTLVKTDFGWVWASTADAVKKSMRMAGMAGTMQYEVKMKEGTLYKLVGDTLAKDRDRKLNVKVRPSVAYSSSHVNTGNQRLSETDWSKYKDRYYIHSAHCWVDGQGRCYKQYSSDEPIEGMVWEAPKPQGNITFGHRLLSAGTTTTTSDEPTSDYDEAVETEEADPDFDPTSWKADSCAACGAANTTGLVVVGKEVMCVPCHEVFKREVEAGNIDEPNVAYTFTMYEADAAYKHFQDSDVMKCDDCGDWSMGSELVYVENEDQFSVCERCYKKNYHPDLTNDSEEEPAGDEPAVLPTGACDGYERVTGLPPRLCVRRAGHKGHCFDNHGVVIGELTEEVVVTQSPVPVN
jgi:Glutamine amidotransferase domain